MTTHKPNLGEEKTGVFNESPVFRNGIAEIPETRSAYKSLLHFAQLSIKSQMEKL